MNLLATGLWRWKKNLSRDYTLDEGQQEGEGKYVDSQMCPSGCLWAWWSTSSKRSEPGGEAGKKECNRKILLTWKFVHESVLKSNVISVKRTPLDHGHIFLCVRAFVNACVYVFAFQATEWCHTVFQQPFVLNITEFLLFINEESRVWKGTRPSPTAAAHIPGLLIPTAAALLPFHASSLKGLQTPKR